jgi:hypothetical protein
MGTPLSKRGDSPAKRWTSANTEAQKAAALANKPKKTTTPLAISTSNVQDYLVDMFSDNYQNPMWFDDMTDAQIKGHTGIISENVRKRVRQIEVKNPGKRANIQKIADEEFDKFKRNYKG